MTDRQHVISPLRIFEGAESLARLRRELKRLNCQRAVVFCGRTLASEGSPLQLVREAASEQIVGIFSGVQAHSPLPAVEAGAEALREHKADAVIAVGGGSAIVTARASSILVAEKKDIHDLCTSRDAHGKLHSPKLMAPKLPQIVVPTTPTTAMAKAGSAVLDPETKSRLALFDPKTRAGSIFLHPELLCSAPKKLFVDASLNSFCSAVEGLMSRRGDPFSDADLMHAVRLFGEHLLGASELDQPDPRIALAYASIMSGRGTDHTAGGLTTALGHAVAAHCGVEAGVIKTIILPHAVLFNAEAAKSGIAKLGLSLDVQEGESEVEAHLGECIAKASRSLGLATKLRATGVKREDFRAIAKKAMSDWFLHGNPRQISSLDELVSILKAAW